MKSFSEFMTEAAFLMRKTGENLVTQKNKSGRAGFPGGFGKHEKVNVGGELGSSNPTRHAKAFGGLKKLMRDRVEAKDAVKHLSKHVDHKPMFDEIGAIKEACGSAHLKVILETGELQTYDNIRRASHLAMLAGADFIKTSTGKVGVNATLPITLLMLQAVRDWHDEHGIMIGVKPAGGIRTAKDAMKYLVVVKETAGDAWLSPEYFRFGASSLLNDVLMQRQKLVTGHYSGPDYVSVD
jgi:hypothetical protein